MWSNIVPIFVTLSRTSYCKKKKMATSSALQLKQNVTTCSTRPTTIDSCFILIQDTIITSRSGSIQIPILFEHLCGSNKFQHIQNHLASFSFFLSAFSFLGNILMKENWCNKEIWLVHNFLKTLIHVRKYITNKGINKRSRCMKF